MTDTAILRERVGAMKLRAELQRGFAVTPMTPAYEMIRDLADVLLALIPAASASHADDR